MKVLAAIAVLVAATTGNAAEVSLRAEYTKGDSALTRSRCPRDFGQDSACWRGKLKLAGLLVIEFDRVPGGAEQTDEVGQTFFEPDASSRGKLPQALGYYPAPVAALWIAKEPRSILVSLLGAERANGVLQGSAPRYEFPVEVVLKEYTSSIECDHRSYGMAYSTIRLLAQETVAQDKTKNFGC